MKKYLYIVFIVFIFSSMLNSFAAETLSDKNNIYQDKLKIYLIGRADYISLYNRYKSTCQKDSPDCQELKEQVLEKIKNHFRFSIEMIISYSEILKLRIDESLGSSEQKDILIKQLDDIQKLFTEKAIKIDNLKTTEDVKLLSQELRTLWLEKEAVFLKVRASIHLWTVESNNNKLNNLAKDLEQYITNLSDKYQTSAILDKYNLSKAKLIELNKALEALKLSISSINKNNINDYKKIKQQFIDYKNLTLSLVKDLKVVIDDLKMKDYKEISSENIKEFYIKGEGQISLSGNFEVSGDIGDAKNLGKVEAFNTDSIDTFEEGQAVKSGDKTVYTGIKKVSIKSKSQLIINSLSIDVVIKGTGKISIKGDGLYKIGEDGTWSDISKDGLEENI